MHYLICLDHRPLHLTCRAAWLEGALRRKGYFARAQHGAVMSAAPLDVVETLLQYRPPRPSPYFRCP
jgi:hypothetical protein